MQKLVSEFIREYNLDCSEQIRYIDLVSEVDELGKELINGCKYGQKTNDLFFLERCGKPESKQVK